MPVLSVTPERVAAVEESVREILREVQVLRLQAGSPASKTAVVRSAIDVYDPAVLLGNEPDPTAMAEDNEKLVPTSPVCCVGPLGRRRERERETVFPPKVWYSKSIQV
jgi:hypothetical protein